MLPPRRAPCARARVRVRAALLVALLSLVALASVGLQAARASPIYVRVINLDVSRANLTAFIGTQPMVSTVSGATVLSFGETSEYVGVYDGFESLNVALPNGTLREEYVIDTSTTTQTLFRTAVLVDRRLYAPAAVFPDDDISTPGSTSLRCVHLRLQLYENPTPTSFLTVTGSSGSLFELPPYATTSFLSSGTTLVDSGNFSLTFAVDANPVVVRDIWGPSGGSVSCFFFTYGAGYEVQCFHDEHVNDYVLAPWSGDDLTGGTLTTALLALGRTSFSVTGETVILNSVMLADSSRMLVSARMQIAQQLILSSNALLSVANVLVQVDSLSLPAGTVYELILQRNVPEHLSVRGQATLGGRLVIDARLVPFLFGYEALVLRCNPCVGNFSDIVVLSNRDADYNARASALSANTANVTCNETECWIRAGWLSNGFARTASGSQNDKIIIACVLGACACIIFGVIVWMVCRSPKTKAVQYHVIHKTLREHENTVIKEQRKQRKRENVLFSGDVSVSVMDVDESSVIEGNAGNAELADDLASTTEQDVSTASSSRSQSSV